jgi:hypothetical protein
MADKEKKPEEKEPERKSYKLLPGVGTHEHEGKVYHPGETISAAEDLYMEFPNKFENPNPPPPDPNAPEEEGGVKPHEHKETHEHKTKKW